jgi:hypothetical protein
MLFMAWQDGTMDVYDHNVSTIKLASIPRAHQEKAKKEGEERFRRLGATGRWAIFLRDR